MSVKRVDSELPLDLKVKVWIANHFKHILFFSMFLALASVIFVFVMSFRFTSLVATQSKVIENLSNKVIFVRADGKVAILEKEPVSEQTIRYVLRDIVISYVPVSAFDFKYSGVNKWEEIRRLWKVNKMMNYIDIETPALNGYRAYLEYVFRLYVADKLPEVIQIPNLEEMHERLFYENGKFEYEVKLPVLVQYVYARKVRTAKGRISVYMKGDIDLRRGTPENPFGIRLTDFKVSEYVEKGS